jgi:pantetheine-phosphate adenylyltransferase
MTRIALYSGSFDPPTRGHEDLIHRAVGLADQLVVAIAVNPAKEPLFSVAERIEQLRAIVGDDPRIRVDAFQGLLVDYARQVGAAFLIRGLRAAGDFEYELQMALMNRQLHRDLETVFLVPASGLTYISSSLVREVARFGGDVSQLVHPTVAAALAKRFPR